ncbi:hypothetical protein ACVWWJ_000671 [Luteibacter sp. HA06]
MRARLQPCGSRFSGDGPLAAHLGVSQGDLGAHPRCSDSPPRSKRKAAPQPCSYWPTAAPLVRNSPRGWTPRSLTTIRSAGRRAAGVGVAAEAGRHGRRAGACIPFGERFLAAALTHAENRDRCVGADPLGDGDGDEPTAEAASLRQLDPTNLRVQESLRCPPSRRVPDKWSGRRPNKYMSRGSGLPVRNAEGCLSSEGGHRRLCALPSRHRRLCAVTSGPAEGKHRR